ncbi:hypothetical protein AHF37_07000 [Paragonimus kellicotti]|nr:hypothetical protein AHF37_07000 [Paragonimus kellicotti]
MWMRFLMNCYGEKDLHSRSDHPNECENNNQRTSQHFLGCLALSWLLRYVYVIHTVTHDSDSNRLESGLKTAYVGTLFVCVRAHSF